MHRVSFDPMRSRHRFSAWNQVLLERRAPARSLCWTSKKTTPERERESLNHVPLRVMLQPERHVAENNIRRGRCLDYSLCRGICAPCAADDDDDDDDDDDEALLNASTQKERKGGRRRDAFAVASWCCPSPPARIPKVQSAVYLARGSAGDSRLQII